MRRALLALIAIGSAGLVGLPASPASAVLGVQADLAITAVGTPASVAPPGGNVIYDVTATNNGPAPSVVVNVKDSVTGGGTIIAGETSVPAGCSVGTTTVTCDDLVLVAGQPSTLRIVVKTPAAVGTVVNSAHISSAAAALDENPGNNDASVSTPVTANNTGSGSLVLGGECLSYKTSAICVPEEVTGVIVALTDSVLNGAMCGDHLCVAGLHVGFTQDEQYKDEDPAHPLILDLSFGRSYPCRSLTDKCATIYVRKDDGNDVYPIPNCDPAGTNTPCLEIKFKDSSADTAPIHWRIHMLSNDPDLLKNLTGG